ncbi:MAG: hypothetical protein L6R38_002731 [Xanthoria sp. 2 TBL-2021]|nr:MAG: hypothetical protein L6R38_002731 [Xanthoria sp. 2 TBL-2021]
MVLTDDTLFQGARWTEYCSDLLHQRSREEAPSATNLARLRQVPNPFSFPTLGPSVAVRTMAALPKRIVKETERLMAEPVPGISAIPHEDNLRYFDVKIHGPSQSPYETGIFQLELFLPDDYPMTPPKIRFLTKIYHPNIDKLGRICLDVLKSNWSPALQIRTILLSIQALLGAPNPDDPLANDVAQRWKEDEKAAIQTAREWTQNYAKA